MPFWGVPLKRKKDSAVNTLQGFFHLLTGNNTPVVFTEDDMIKSPGG